MSRRSGPPLVTLTTDIGAAYAAQMKAVLASEAPAARVVDLTHEIAPHSIGEGAFLLLHMARGFPRGTIHVAIIDPGVGGHRAPVAVRCREGSWLVGPDNGVLYPLADALGIATAWRLDPRRVRGGSLVHPTFEGRDLFAPAAARIANGAGGADLGTPWELLPLRLPEPKRVGRGADGITLHVDRFGNVITNVPTGWAPPPGTRVLARVGRGRERPVPRARTYADLRRGELGLLGSSFGLLELSRREAPAAGVLRAESGSPVRLRWPADGSPSRRKRVNRGGDTRGPA